MTIHFAVGKARTKRPALRCKHQPCAHLTRHRDQVCPIHRKGNRRTSTEPTPSYDLDLPYERFTR